VHLGWPIKGQYLGSCAAASPPITEDSIKIFIGAAGWMLFIDAQHTEIAVGQRGCASAQWSSGGY